jgi:hypothetical protein
MKFANAIKLDRKSGVAYRRDLQFHFRIQANVSWASCLGFRFSINTNCRSLHCGRDDKFEGGGSPLHGWRWMDRTVLQQPPGFARPHSLPRTEPPTKPQPSIAATTAIAVMPAVSARKMRGPKLTGCQPSAAKSVSSSAVHPPSGPTARFTAGLSTAA